MHETFIRLFFLAHITATLYMTGLIWFVQIVHYPLFARVGNAEFSAYEQRHTALDHLGCGSADACRRDNGIDPVLAPTRRRYGRATLDRSRFAGRHLDFDRLCPGTLSRRVVAGIRQDSTSATGSDQLAQDVSLELTCPAGALDGVGDTAKCWRVRPRPSLGRCRHVTEHTTGHGHSTEKRPLNAWTAAPVTAGSDFQLRVEQASRLEWLGVESRTSTGELTA